MKTPIVTIAAGVLGACLLASCAYLPDVGKILPDKKSEYKKSESMPDLEVPPDLTADAINDSMNIPNEAPVTLSRYNRPRAAGTRPPAASGTTEADEQWLSLAMPLSQLWPELLEFVKEQNYSIELEDSELGVLETDWSQVEEQVGLQYRYKYKLFAEPGATADITMLIISQQRQSRRDDSADWLDLDKDAGLEKQFVVDLGRFVDVGEPAGQPMPARAAAPATAATGPRVVDAGEGKMYLNIPEAFEQAWANTGVALRNGGMQVVSEDAAEGVYQVTAAGQDSEKKGFFSKLAFWKGGRSETASYGISLTGVGAKTELIVVNEDGEWEDTGEAARLLALIRDRYPRN